MRDPQRIPKVLGRIRAAWEQNPDLRFGQLVDIVRELGALDMFYAEDGQWADAFAAYQHGRLDSRLS